MNINLRNGEFCSAVFKNKIKLFTRRHKSNSRRLCHAFYAAFHIIKRHGILNNLGVFASYRCVSKEKMQNISVFFL